jgi:hypothetical protein
LPDYVSAFCDRTQVFGVGYFGALVNRLMSVSITERPWKREQWSKYHDMMQRLDEAWQIHDELMRVAMERRGGG